MKLQLFLFTIHITKRDVSDIDTKVLDSLSAVLLTSLSDYKFPNRDLSMYIFFLILRV